MNASKGEFDLFLEKEVSRIKGNYTPVRSSFLRRKFTRYLKCSEIHPNPGDEFCDPAIGPNYGIVSDYVQTIGYEKRQHGEKLFFEDPVMVERITPDGYLLLNGHHRWAAAIKTGLPKIHAEVVNLTQQKDIYEMLSRSKNNKRVVLDLDEVVFRAEFDELSEKPLRFAFGRIINEPMRLGIPALFNDLKKRGYDIWVYTSRYVSYESMLYYFRRHHTYVSGVVTGMKRKSGAMTAIREQIEKKMNEQYEQTLHIDNDYVVRVNRKTKTYGEHRIDGPEIQWAGRVMEIVDEIGEKE